MIRIQQLWSNVSYFVVLGVIVAIGAWGHHTHWSFASTAHGDEPTSAADGNSSVQEVADLEKVTGEEFPSINFPTHADVETAGVSAMTAGIRDVNDEFNASAVVDYDQTHLAELAPRVPGHVYSVLKRLGQPVRKGDVIVLIDSDDVGRVKGEFLQHSVMSVFRAQQLQRIKSIGVGVVPERTIREADAALQEADLLRFNAHQHLVNLGFNIDLPKSEKLTTEEMARRIQFLGIPDEIVAKMDPRPQTANLIPMVAPFDGIIVKQETVRGEMVRPETCSVTIADLRRMWLKLSLRKEDAERVALGQNVTFQADGLSETVEGKITWISPEIDPKTRTVQAQAELINPAMDEIEETSAMKNVSATENPGLEAAGDPEIPNFARRMLSVHQFGVASIRVNSIKNAVVVPESAIQKLWDGATIVFVANNDETHFQPRRVQLGLLDDGYYQVINGLDADERVVSKGAFTLKSELMKSLLAKK